MAALDSGGVINQTSTTSSGTTGSNLTSTFLNTSGSTSPTPGTLNSPSTPQGLTARSGVDNYAQAHTAFVVVTWTPNPVADFVSRYDIYWHKGSDAALHNISVGGDVNSVRVNDVFPGTTYTFAVQAHDAANRSSLWSPELDVVISLDSDPPAVPTNLAATSTGTGVYLSWTEVGAEGISHDLKQYRVAVSLDGGVTYPNLHTIGPGNSFFYTPTTSNQGTVFFKVASVDWTGNVSAFSSVASATVGTILGPTTSSQRLTLTADYSVVGDNLIISSTTGSTKGGWIGFADAGTDKWELGKDLDQTLILWDNVKAWGALNFVSNGGTATFNPLVSFNNGASISSGLTIVTGGETITAGDLTLTAGNLTVSAGEITAQDLKATGLTGAAVNPTRIVGVTNGGPPTSGTFVQNDIVYDQSVFSFLVCTVGGSPGTWLPQGGALTSPKAPTIVTTGGAAGSFTYEVVAYNSQGDAIPSATIHITNGPTTLDSTHYNTINWTAPIGCAPTGYKVIRTVGGPTQGKIFDVGSGTLTVRDDASEGAAVAFTAATTNPGGGFVVGGQKYRARAYTAGTQALGAATWTKANLDTKDYDPNGNFDTTAHTYTIPVGGFYFFAAFAEASSGGGNLHVAVSKNVLAGEVNRFMRGGTGSVATNGGGGAAEHYFVAGDVIEVDLHTDAASNIDGGIGSGTFLAIAYRGS